MNIRFYNARILPLDGRTPLFSGELIVSGGRIAALGETCGFTGAIDREIDCGGNLLMPGFKNAHTHSAMTFLRSMADDLPLQRWMTEQVFPKEAQLTPDDIYVLTKLAILEYHERRYHDVRHVFRPARASRRPQSTRAFAPRWSAAPTISAARHRRLRTSLRAIPSSIP